MNKIGLCFYKQGKERLVVNMYEIQMEATKNLMETKFMKVMQLLATLIF